MQLVVIKDYDNFLVKLTNLKVGFVVCELRSLSNSVSTSPSPIRLSNSYGSCLDCRDRLWFDMRLLGLWAFHCNDSFIFMQQVFSYSMKRKYKFNFVQGQSQFLFLYSDVVFLKILILFLEFIFSFIWLQITTKAML